MRLFRIPLLKRLAKLWLIGGLALALATWICFTLGLNPAAAGFVYLTIIVLLSLWDSFLSSAIFSLASVYALNYFFIPPLFSFEVRYDSDIPLLGIFVLTSFVITGLVRRLQKSAKTLKRQAQLLDLTHDTVIARDHRDVITFWNRGAETLYGWRHDEAIERSLMIFWHRVPYGSSVDRRCSAQFGSLEGELVNTKRTARRSSSQADGRCSVTIAANRSGTLETNNDVTERRRAEDALRRSQAAYLAEAQKLSLTGSFGWNVTNGGVFWSDQTFSILGYEPSTTPSIEVMLEQVHPDDVESVRHAIDRTSGDRSEFDIEFRLLLPGGTIKHVHAVARAMEGMADKSQFVGALMDVTAAKRAESRLHEAQAQMAHVARVTSLGALSASIAHEVNAAARRDRVARRSQPPLAQSRRPPARRSCIVDPARDRQWQARERGRSAGPCTDWQDRAP